MKQSAKHHVTQPPAKQRMVITASKDTKAARRAAFIPFAPSNTSLKGATEIKSDDSSAFLFGSKVILQFISRRLDEVMKCELGLHQHQSWTYGTTYILIMKYLS